MPMIRKKKKMVDNMLVFSVINNEILYFLMFFHITECVNATSGGAPNRSIAFLI